jgi:hypothetical protein
MKHHIQVGAARVAYRDDGPRDRTAHHRTVGTP